MTDHTKNIMGMRHITASMDGEDLHIDVLLPPKKFKTGKNGFFRQVTIEVNGKRYRANIMAYEEKPKEKKTTATRALDL